VIRVKKVEKYVNDQMRGTCGHFPRSPVGCRRCHFSHSPVQNPDQSIFSPPPRPQASPYSGAHPLHGKDHLFCLGSAVPSVRVVEGAGLGEDDGGCARHRGCDFCERRATLILVLEEVDDETE